MVRGVRRAGNSQACLDGFRAPNGEGEAANLGGPTMFLYLKDPRWVFFYYGRVKYLTDLFADFLYH